MKIRIRVDSRIRVDVEGLEPGFRDRLRDAFTHDNPAYPNPRDPEEPPRIETYGGETNGEQSLVYDFPRGGMARVRQILEPGFQLDVADARTWRHPEPGFPPHRLVLRPYQERMVAAAERAETCLLRAGVGAGKTCAAFGLLARLRRRSLVIVWEGGLERQWRERCASELGIDEAKVGTIRGNRERIEPVTVAMQQSLVRRFQKGDASLADAFDVVVADEVQRFAAPTLVDTIDPFSARYRIGISADHTRRDRKEFLTEDLFGEVAIAVENSELVAAGATVDVEMLVVPTEFKANWYRFRRDFNQLLNKMCADPARNELLMGVVGRIVQQGHQCLVFTHRVEHAREIDSRFAGLGIKSGCMLGGVENKAAYDAARDSIRSGRGRVGIGTYGAIAQGIDLPTVSRGVAATPIGNNRQLVGQVRGRLCRQPGGKDVGKLVYLLDPVYSGKPVRNFVEWFGGCKVLDERRWVDGSEWIARRRR